jgi:3-hydroxyacyl-CoA dehydrogenase
VGIAMCVANAGLAAVLMDRSTDQVDAARSRIAKTYASAMAKGRLTPGRAEAAQSRIAFTADTLELGECDLVIEAVFEDRAIKQAVIESVAGVVRADAIIATNTSMLDVDDLALACPRPERFLGLHFFSPADVMKLLEVVAGKATSPQVLQRAARFGRALGKIPVICGNGEGFIGNYVLDRYGREADLLVEDGATPWQVDAAMRRFGFPMGLFEMRDMAGLDVVWRMRQERREWERTTRYPRLIDRLHDAGRLGQKSGAGYYVYQGRVGSPDPLIDDLSRACAAAAGITRRDVGDDEVEQRLLGAMVCAGAQLLDQGIASSAADIDLVMVHGFGFPRAKGGPMHWAIEHGIGRIADQVAGWRETEGGERWPPCPRLTQAGRTGQWCDPALV